MNSPFGIKVDPSIKSAIDEMKLAMLRGLCSKHTVYCQISGRKGRPLTWTDVKGMTVFNDAAENVLLGDPAGAIGDMLGGVNNTLPSIPPTPPVIDVDSIVSAVVQAVVEAGKQGAFK
jgi:hypothetical protein